jgi:2'-5' RNA ligase
MVDPKSIHITLKFLGEVHEEKISTIAAALQMIVMTPFNVTVGPVGGNRRDRPRMIWSDIRGEGKCVALATAIDDRLAPLGFPREERPYHPHATVARVKEFDPSLISAIRSLPPGEFGSFTVEGFSLKKSTLTPDGPRYEDLCTIRWE